MPQRAELEDPEGPIAIANAKLAEQNRSGAVQLDGNRHDDQHWQQQEQGKGREQDVNYPLLDPVGQRQLTAVDDQRWPVGIAADPDGPNRQGRRYDDFGLDVEGLEHQAPGIGALAIIADDDGLVETGQQRAKPGDHSRITAFGIDPFGADVDNLAGRSGQRRGAVKQDHAAGPELVAVLQEQAEEQDPADTNKQARQHDGRQEREA